MKKLSTLGIIIGATLLCAVHRLIEGSAYQYKADILKSQPSNVIALGQVDRAPDQNKLCRYRLSFYRVRSVAAKPLIWETVYKSLAFVVLVSALTVIEETVVGLIDGKTIGAPMYPLAF
jgi:hypothetical protein